MAYFALFYELVDDYVNKRMPFRAAHFGLARESEARGELVMAGAFSDPADRALLVFRAGDRMVAEAFAENDPYVINGLVRKWEVRPWTVVLGGDPAEPGPPPPAPAGR